MKSTLGLCSAVLLAAAPALAIPPEDFGFPSAPNDTILSMAFVNNGTRTNIIAGAQYGYGIAAEAPQVGVNVSQYSSLADYDGPYLLVMADPDAPSPENPTSRWVWHWAQTNLTKADLEDDMNMPLLLSPDPDTPALVPYARPMPPEDSPAHRYIFWIFEQPDNFSVPEQYSGFGAENRTEFNLTAFVADTDLDGPVAANYFYVSNQDDVPDDYVGAPGSTYPGGNEGAVTQGPGPSATPTASESGSMTASATGSMTASSTSDSDESEESGGMGGGSGGDSMEGGEGGEGGDAQGQEGGGEGGGDAGNSAAKVGGSAAAAGLAAAVGALLLVAV